MATSMEIDELDDFIKDLLLVEIPGTDKFGGWNPRLLGRKLLPIEEKLLVCTNCKGLMREACTLKVCEVCTEKGNKVVPNVDTRETVHELELNCALNKEGCDWHGLLSDLVTHVGQCSFIPVTCPNGCLDSDTNKKLLLQRSELESHLGCVCPIRKIKCEYCEDFIKANELNNHMQSCDHFPISCPKGCYDDDSQLRKVKRKSIQYHLLKECPNKEVECPFSIHGCKVQLARDNLQLHMEESLVEHLKFLNTSITNRDTAIEELSEKSDKKDKKLNNLSKEIEAKEEEISDLTRKVDKFDRLIVKLTDRVEQLESQPVVTRTISTGASSGVSDKEITELKNKIEEDGEKITDLEESTLKHRQLFYKFSEHVLTPYVIWEIKNVKKHIAEKSDIYSSLFYSQFYKFELNAVFNYDDNNHLGLYCFLNKGDYDDYLVWPFVGSYHFTIISQNEKESDYTKFVYTSTKPDEIKVYNDKPTEARNNGWGLKRFISLGDLVKPTYCSYDTIKLKLLVKPKASNS